VEELEEFGIDLGVASARLGVACGGGSACSGGRRRACAAAAVLQWGKKGGFGSESTSESRRRRWCAQFGKKGTAEGSSTASC
jgi:hypothetical protein